MANELLGSQLARETLVAMSGGQLRPAQLARETLVGVSGGRLLPGQLVRETLVAYDFTVTGSDRRRQAMLGSF